MKVSKVNLDGFLASAAKTAKRDIVLVTGVSGSGKDFVAAKAAETFGRSGPLIILLDEIASKQDNRWLVNINKLKEVFGSATEQGELYVGWSDNLADVAKTLRDEYEGELHLVWISPSPTIFRKANAAKAAEAPVKVGGWKEDWAAKARWTDAKIGKYLEDKMDLVVAKIKPDLLTLVENTREEGSISKGWHGESKTMVQTDKQHEAVGSFKSNGKTINVYPKAGESAENAMERVRKSHGLKD